MPNRDIPYRDREGRTFDQYVADRVMAAIVENGLSVLAVARESGINRETLRERLHNRYPFTTRELALVAAALGVHPDTFVSGFRIA